MKSGTGVILCAAALCGGLYWYTLGGRESQVRDSHSNSGSSQATSPADSSQTAPDDAESHDPSEPQASPSQEASATPTAAVDDYSFASDDQKTASDRCGSPSLFLIFTGVVIKNGVMTCSMNMEDVENSGRPDEITSRQGVAQIFETMHDNYPTANTYVVLYKGNSLDNSRRFVLQHGSFRDAAIGQGESGTMHFDQEKLGSAIAYYEDGLQKSDW